MTAPARQPEASPEFIRAEVARILSSVEFSGSRHLTNFLRFVVEESLAGRGDRLKERNIALGALGRDADFDPRLDCIVRVVAGKLRRALDRYYAVGGAANPLRVAVPAGSYVPVFQQPAGTPAERSSRAAAAPGSMPPRANGVGRPLLAIVPFRTHTAGADERLLGDLLAEDVAVRLSRRSWLEVLDYRSSSPPGAEVDDVQGAAARVSANFALAGTIGRVGDRVRLTVRLIDVASGVLAWAERFESDPGNERAAWHDDTVSLIVGRIGDLYGVLTASAWSHAAQRRCELTAFEAVLSSLQYQCRFDGETFPRVLRQVERAVMKNPEFGWGWTALGALHLCLMCSIAAGGPPDQPEQALAYIKRGLRLDPTCSYAHFLLGVHHLFCERADGAVACAGETLELALESPLEVASAGMLLSLAGEHEQGEPLIRRALTINPRLPGWIHWGSAIGAFCEGDLDSALAAVRRFTLPDCFWDPLLDAVILAEAGDRSAARASLDRACRLQPELSLRPRELVGKFVVRPVARERVFANLGNLGLRISGARTSANGGVPVTGRGR
jgi:adenylate cyclase